MLEITPDTSVLHLVDEYPFLVDFLASYNPRFRLLKNPVLRRTAGRAATLAKAAKMGGVELGELTRAIEDAVRKWEAGSSLSRQVDPGQYTGPSRDRVTELKALIRDLHSGLSPQDAQDRFDEAVRDLTAQELGAVEEELIRDGLPVEEIQRLCDLHVSVVRSALDKNEETTAPPGHPAHTCMAENEIISALANRLGELCGRVDADTGEQPATTWRKEMEDVLERLSGIHNHYLRKENELFPVLERHGITGPSQVMWGVDDEIRSQLKALRHSLGSAPMAEVARGAAALSRSLVEMVYKENKILIPLTMETLDPGEWAAIRRGEDELGYAFAEPEGPFPGGGSREEEQEKTPPGIEGFIGGPGLGRGKEGAIPLPIVPPDPGGPLPQRDSAYLDLGTGRLSLEQVDMILRHLPVDLSFVDAEGFVRYYSETPDRLFPRTPGAIGRHVTNCHPPKSVHMVNEILEAFSSGKRDVAEFWIQMKERFVHIRYFAVRNPQGEYLGCLEASQDVTSIRALEGEQRLLEWQ